MSEIADIKRRLDAVSQTRQITNAMYLISSTRMRKEAKRVDYSREYFTRIRTTVADIINKSSGITHPYMHKREGHRAAFLVIAGDKGLCGSYNIDLLRFAEKKISEYPEHYIETVGRMTSEYFRRRGISADADIPGATKEPTLYTARAITETLVQLYEQELTDEVFIIFTRFYSSVHTEPFCLQLLPMLESDFTDAPSYRILPEHIIYEPSPRTVFDELIPQCAVGIIFSALVQAMASEHSARMNSMKNATTNADEITAKLRHEYQTQRQLAITNEIIEITAGAAGAQSSSRQN